MKVSIVAQLGFTKTTSRSGGPLKHLFRNRAQCIFCVLRRSTRIWHLTGCRPGIRPQPGPNLHSQAQKCNECSSFQIYNYLNLGNVPVTCDRVGKNTCPCALWSVLSGWTGGTFLTPSSDCFLKYKRIGSKNGGGFCLPLSCVTACLRFHYYGIIICLKIPFFWIICTKSSLVYELEEYLVSRLFIFLGYYQVKRIAWLCMVKANGTHQ